MVVFVPKSCLFDFFWLRFFLSYREIHTVQCKTPVTFYGSCCAAAVSVCLWESPVHPRTLWSSTGGFRCKESVKPSLKATNTTSWNYDQWPEKRDISYISLMQCSILRLSWLGYTHLQSGSSHQKELRGLGEFFIQDSIQDYNLRMKNLPSPTHKVMLEDI